MGRYMKGQARTGMAACLTAFGEGLVEPIGAAILFAITFAFIAAFNSSSVTSPSSWVLVEYLLSIFVITVGVNFFKGIVSPDVAFSSAAGMLLGLILFGSSILTIAPDAGYEVIAYIAAAAVGIWLGISARSSNR